MGRQPGIDFSSSYDLLSYVCKMCALTEDHICHIVAYINKLPTGIFTSPISDDQKEPFISSIHGSWLVSVSGAFGELEGNVPPCGTE